MKFLNKLQASKLRAGHTVYRCQINAKGIVNIDEILLKGAKITHSFYGCPSKRIGKAFINDLISVPCFASRRDALKFKATVNEPQFEQLREKAIEHWEEMNEMWSYPRYDIQLEYEVTTA